MVLLLLFHVDFCFSYNLLLQFFFASLLFLDYFPDLLCCFCICLFLLHIFLYLFCLFWAHPDQGPCVSKNHTWFPCKPQDMYATRWFVVYMKPNLAEYILEGRLAATHKVLWIVMANLENYDTSDKYIQIYTSKSWGLRGKPNMPNLTSRFGRLDLNASWCIWLILNQFQYPFNDM